MPTDLELDQNQGSIKPSKDQKPQQQQTQQPVGADTKKEEEKKESGGFLKVLEEWGLISKDSQTVKDAQAKTTTSLPKLSHDPSQIQKQPRDARGQADFDPCRIIFLTGPLKGKDLDLGLAVNQFTTSQDANWDDHKGQGIRPGANYTMLSARTFNLKLTYFHGQYDISQLGENVAHLMQIGEGEKTPPKFLFVSGKLKAGECVCTRYNVSYDHPMAGKTKGMHFCEVDLDFKLIGGKNSPYALGAPLAPTPLNDYIQTTTAEERKALALQTDMETILDPCLDEESSEQLKKLIEDGKQNDPAAIAELKPDAFMQAAIAGIFSKGTLENETLNGKLADDLAKTIAVNEPGVASEANLSSQLYQAIKNNDPTLIGNPDIQRRFAEIKRDYDLMLDAIQKQDLGNNSGHEIYNRDKNPTAYDRLTRFGNCGMQMRNLGTQSVETKTNTDNAKMLEEINKLLANGSNEDIKKAFGVTTDSQIKTLKNSAPYTSKDQFLKDAFASQGGSASGYSLWHTFDQHLSGKESVGNNNDQQPGG